MPSSPLAAVLAASVALLALGGCSDSPTKATQGAGIASTAGLTTEVADFFALATRGGDGTFKVTYTTSGSDGSAQQVTLTQRPPDRRVDVFHSDGSIDATIRVGGITYQSAKPQGWTSAVLPDQPSSNSTGVLADESVRAAVDKFHAGAADYDFAVDRRQLAGTQATCLVTTRKQGHDADPSLGASATLCLSTAGAQLLVEVPRGKLEATDYSPDVPSDAFTLPAEVASN